MLAPRLDPRPLHSFVADVHNAGPQLCSAIDGGDMVRRIQLRAAVAAVALAAGFASSVQAQCDPCWTLYYNRADAAWDCKYSASGTACDDGNACTSGDHCDGRGSCVGTLACVPGTPGAIGGPSSSSDGSYTLSWNPASGTVNVYHVYENGVGVYTTGGLSVAFSGKLQGNFVYTVQACNSVGCGAFTAGFTVTVVPPGVPGPVSSGFLQGNTSGTGSYSLSWSAPGSGRWYGYELYENGTLLGSVSYESYPVTARNDGAYRYKVRACGPTGCGGFTNDFVMTVLLPPGAPGAIIAPLETGPSYDVAWGTASGTIDHYELCESNDAGASWSPATSITTTSMHYTGKAYGTYTYRVRACNATACSGWVSASLSVVVITGLSALQDSPVVPPSVPVPPQAWAGTLPGTPGAEGGAASYRIPIEIPPGRAGMQPEVSLTYSSTNGSGIAGVGWSLAGARSTIYRCPRTLAQEGGNRPVLHDANDRLCWDGQRLVTAAGNTYGSANSQYRTEIDQFARITLYNDMSSPASYLLIEHKSGRLSKYLTQLPATVTRPPDVWYLDSEWDRQNNCIKYRYVPYSYRGNEPELVLANIYYTGTANNQTCNTDSSARSIELTYRPDREDKRTTYAYGVPSISTARLAAISTKVGTTYVRRYQLSYHLSAATRRSLLDSVTLCAQPGSVTQSCGSEQFPATTFQYQEDAPNFDMWHATCQSPSGCGAYAYGQPLGNEWTMPIAGDMDGDGTRDAVYQSADESDLLLTTCQTAQKLTGTINGSLYIVGFDHLVDGTPFYGFPDFNNDGRVDIIGSSNQYAALATATCGSPANWQTRVTNLLMQQTGGAPFVWGIDYDGDGLFDLAYNLVNGPTYIQLRRARDPLNWSSSYPLRGATVPAGSSSSMNFAMMRDINGDGLVDTIFDDYKKPYSDTTTIAFLRPGSAQLPYTFGAQPYTYETVPQLGGPAGSSFNGDSRKRWIDVNGDGLPDIYDPAGYIWINKGGPLNSIFVPYALAVPTLDPNRTLFQFVMDIDGDGREELLVPNTRVWDACLDVANATEPLSYCGAQFDTGLGWHYLSSDKSVFQWDAYKFIEASDGSFSMVKVPTGLRAPTSVSVLQNDSNGDGTTDLYYSLQDATMSYYSVTPASGLGPYITRNLMRAPDLLIAATNGLGAIASWKHRPLSNTAKAIDPVRDYDADVGCDMPEPFYAAHPPAPDLATYSDHAFFASSMWAVARLDISNGVGTTNKTCYRYQDAMLNMEGRGFQGFKTIVAEEQMPPAAGEAPSTVQGCGGLCSPNNLKTTTQFHQAFPLAGKPVSVTVAKASGGILQQTSYWWHIDGGSVGQKIVFSSGTLEQKYETAGTPASQTTTVSEVQPSVGVPTLSGEPVRTCVIVNGETPSSPPNTGTASDVISLETRTLHDDPAAWWLGRLDSRVILSDFLGPPYSFPACNINVTDSTGSFAGACAASPPGCPSVTASGNAKTQTATYQWWPDTDPQSRKINSVAVTIPSDASGTSEITTSYAYDSHGNLLTKAPAARDVGTDSTWPPSTRGASLMPSSIYVYSSDGYFEASETDPAGHVSTKTTDPATGLVLTSRAIQGGPVTTNSYDDMGRLLTSTTTGAQPVQTRITACPQASNCAWKAQSFQSGAPVKTTYHDILGREFATGAEGFDGKETITKVTFNERGLKIAEYPPYRLPTLPGGWDGIAVSPYPTTYSGFDALKRPMTKTVQRGSAVCQSGTCDAALTTNYSYAVVPTGIKTQITVSKAAAVGGSLKMSRTYDRGGKLVETVQYVSPSSSGITTTYYYDPVGHLTTISDPAGNTIKVTYDDLGRKLTVNDPDRGNWTYTWDGLGRLRTQTDARGVMLAYEYDVDGRLERRFKQAPGDAQATVEANWQYDLNGKAGTLGAMIGTLDGFRRDYSYDSLLRPWRMSTYVPGNAGSWTSRQFNVEYGYDRYYGRIKAMAYPGQGDAATGAATGEIVGFNYSDPRGYPIGESANAPFGSPVYRTVSAMSQRGQVTSQTFANGVHESASYDDPTGLPLELVIYNLNEHQPSGCSQPLLARQVDYKFDQFLNLASQSKQFLQRDVNGQVIWQGCTPAGSTAEESYQYDDLQRLTTSTRSWAGLTPIPYPAVNGLSHTYGDSYTYDDSGDILIKPDYATGYTYGTSSRVIGNAGPHAVSTVTESGITTAPFTYDMNGNMVSGDGRTVTFDPMDRPVTIAKGGVTTQFRYAPDGARYLQYTSGIGASPYPKTVYYVDKFYERIDWSSAVTEEKTYVGSPVIVYKQGMTRDVRYLHTDRLGSLDVVTNSAGAELPSDSHGFDAFGMPRARDWQWSGARLHPDTDYQKTTEHGFTGHEHLDETYLIHMDGRIYDYRLGRFLSVDPIISNPANGQAINPYSYVGNNPLSGIDPTGYACVQITGSNICYDSEVNAGQHGVFSSLTAYGNNPYTSSSGSKGQPTDTTTRPADQTLSPSVNGVMLAQAEPPPEEEAPGGTRRAEQPPEDAQARLSDGTYSRAREALESLGGKVPSEIRDPTKPRTQEEIESIQRDVLRAAEAAKGARTADPATPQTNPGRSEDPKVVAERVRPTIERIKAGQSFPHRNDGKVFENREGKLPPQPNGYYREYVHPTPGLKGPGPQRVVIGLGGEMYYSPDHYETFIGVKP